MHLSVVFLKKRPRPPARRGW